MSFCNTNYKAPKRDPFIGCDGKVWSNEFLQYHIDKAVSEENYEWALECDNEMKRRMAKTKTKKK